MKFTNIVLLLSILSAGVSNAAETSPCNGFKIDLKNHTKQPIVIDEVILSNGTITSNDPQPLDVDKTASYTVNSTSENGIMHGEFLLHTMGPQQKELRINFNLTNKSLICELGNTMQQGALRTSFDRVPGGLILPLKE